MRRTLKVFRVFEDSKGRIWASGQAIRIGEPLAAMGSGYQAISRLEDGPKGHQLVSAFAEDHHGNIWMGLWGDAANYSVTTAGISPRLSPGWRAGYDLRAARRPRRPIVDRFRRRRARIAGEPRPGVIPCADV
jgi:hypothetical protein